MFSCAKDNSPTVWFSENGERLGTYDGHKGTVWDCDPSFNSTRLLTGSADQHVKLWDLQSGKELFDFEHKSGIRSVGWSHGEKMFLCARDNTFSQSPMIFIYNVAEDLADQSDVAVREMSIDNHQKLSVALWGNLNSSIISCGDDGRIRRWDVETGKEEMRVDAHTKAINDMQFSRDFTMLITASSDYTVKVFDAKSLECMKTFKSDRPLNAAAISPIANHIILGGGQEAMNVTVTSAKMGHFEVDFHHLVFQQYLGSIKGHFGPVNTLAFLPNGRGYASGAEDGYIRLNHFDKSYMEAARQF